MSLVSMPTWLSHYLPSGLSEVVLSVPARSHTPDALQRQEKPQRLQCKLLT